MYKNAECKYSNEHSQKCRRSPFNICSSSYEILRPLLPDRSTINEVLSCEFLSFKTSKEVHSAAGCVHPMFFFDDDELHHKYTLYTHKD
jgi:hypothetical protein